MLKLIAPFLKRRARVEVLTPGVHFHHRQPAVPNLGDALCTPQNYFDFESDQPVLVLGGGAFNGLGCEEAQRFAAPIRICWGTGQSWRFGTSPKPLDMPTLQSVYRAASTRDPSVAADWLQLLPCVSVLHPIVDIPPGTRPGVFLNQDQNASGERVDDILKGYHERDFLTGSNAMSVQQFSALYAETAELLTNSYHAAYWGLLSGREVRLVGYSSKFVDLLALFDLPHSGIIRYERGNSAGLEAALDAALKRPAVSLNRHEDTKARFREMNFAFAASMSSFGVIVSPRSPL